MSKYQLITRVRQLQDLSANKSITQMTQTLVERHITFKLSWPELDDFQDTMIQFITGQSTEIAYFSIFDDEQSDIPSFFVIIETHLGSHSVKVVDNRVKARDLDREVK